MVDIVVLLGSKLHVAWTCGNGKPAESYDSRAITLLAMASTLVAMAPNLIAMKVG